MPTPPSDYSQSRLASLRRWVRHELKAIGCCFRFTPHNSPTQKILLWVVVGIWAVITVGIAFGHATPTTEYSAITAVVWALFGRVWGAEATALGGSGSNEP